MIEIITIETNNFFVDLLMSVIAPINGAVKSNVRFEMTKVQLRYCADKTESIFEDQYWL